MTFILSIELVKNYRVFFFSLVAALRCCVVLELAGWGTYVPPPACGRAKMAQTPGRARVRSAARAADEKCQHDWQPYQLDGILMYSAFRKHSCQMVWVLCDDVWRVVFDDVWVLMWVLGISAVLATGIKWHRPALF